MEHSVTFQNRIVEYRRDMDVMVKILEVMVLIVTVKIVMVMMMILDIMMTKLVMMVIICKVSAQSKGNWER